MKIILVSFVILMSCSFISSAQTTFVRSCAQKSFPSTVPAGNYSGISHIEGNLYAVVSDKSDTDGFFIFQIDVDSISGDILYVENMGFRGDSLKNADCEAIAYNTSRGTFFISRESDNEICEYDVYGKFTGHKLDVPYAFKNSVGNYGFESLAYDPETHLFWTINESTLPNDGICATSTNKARNVLRLQSFGEDLKPSKQYAYMMDAPIADKKSANYAMGVSEITAVGNGCLLVLEREFFVPNIKVGAFVQCKIYEVMPDSEESISQDAEIDTNTQFVHKRLLFSFITKLNLFDWAIANYEGMCLGPNLADGSRVLILVSDSQNNYGGVLKDWFKTIVIR